MKNEAEVTVHIVLGMDAASPLRDALDLIDRIAEDVGYHPDTDKLRECIELAADFIDTRPAGD